ncbi:MAG: hypothetical protein ACTSXO_11125 [Candidatus Heimdallarchaeota archaeon]
MLFNSVFNYTNIIAGTISIIVTLIIFLKDFRSKINILFSASLFFWGISLIFNGLTFLFQHPTRGAQTVRDFVVISSTIAAFLLFLSAIVIYEGEYILKKWFLIVPLTIFLFINSFVTSYFDKVVYDSPDETVDIGNGIKTTQPVWVMIFLYVIPLLLIIKAIIYLILTKKETRDPLIRSRMNYFIIGFSFIVLGAMVFSGSGIIEQLFIPLSTETELTIFFVAELFWILGPILMLVGINVKQIDENVSSKNVINE